MGGKLGPLEGSDQALCGILGSNLAYHFTCLGLSFLVCIGGVILSHYFYCQETEITPKVLVS